MKNPYSIFISAIFCWSSSIILQAQVPSPGKVQIKPVLIQNAVIHVGQGDVLPKGELLFDKGKIVEVNASPRSRAEAELLKLDRIDAKGSHVYPGFILMNTPLGLNEIDAVRATIDLAEVGKENPNVQAISAYNTDSDIIPTLRSNGVLMAQISPRGSRLRGFSSVVHLDAWNWEDACIRKGDGLHIEWPSKYKAQGWWAEPAPVQGNAEVNQEIEGIEKTFEAAKMYQESSRVPLNARLQALAAVLNGQSTLYLHARYSADIVAAILFAQKFKVPKYVLVSGPGVLDVLSLVKTHRIPVVLSRLHSLPELPDSPLQEPVTVAVDLMKAGILVGLDYGGDMEIMGSRNLGFLAGSAVREGLDKEKALQLITGNPARILDLDKKIGTLEVGKDATLFISSGDALDISTQQLTHAWIQGRSVSLESKQTELYKKFKEKAGQ